MVIIIHKIKNLYLSIFLGISVCLIQIIIWISQLKDQLFMFFFPIISYIFRLKSNFIYPIFLFSTKIGIPTTLVKIMSLIYSLNFLNLLLIMCLSTLYGFICINSCLIGHKMNKNDELKDKLNIFKSSLIFLTFGVALYLFVFKEAISKGENPPYHLGSFMLALILIGLIVSFMYIIFGYLSYEKNNNYNSLLILFSCSISFSIGTVFNTFILEIGKIVGWIGDYWIFLCLWTINIVIWSFFIINNEMNVSDAMRKIINFLMSESLNL